jgi:hypothetical protein
MSHASSAGVINQFIKEEEQEIDETEDEANNIIKNKMRRLIGSRKLISRKITIDNDNIDYDENHDGDENHFFENAQDADNRSISQLGANLRSKKRRERALTTGND